VDHFNHCFHRQRTLAGELLQKFDGPALVASADPPMLRVGVGNG